MQYAADIFIPIAFASIRYQRRTKHIFISIASGFYPEVSGSKRNGLWSKHTFTLKEDGFLRDCFEICR